MKLLTIFMVILMTVLLFSCHKTNENSIETQDVTYAAPHTKEPNAVFNVTDSTASGTISPDHSTALQAGSPANIDWDKKIIKTANVRLEVKDFNNYNSTVQSNVKKYGGYIASEQLNQNDYKIENVISIKVPVHQFEALVNSLSGTGVTILERTITSEDVTGEVVDTKARIAAKKQVRERYLDLLKQARNMKEILEVQNEINSIQEDIEAGAGRVDYLVHQAAYSTVHLTFFQFIEGKVQPDEEPSFFKKLVEAFSTGSTIVKGFVLLVVTLWPIWLIGIITYLLIKKYPFKLLSKSNK